ncbi:unnamed protein product [Urochloa decumbens]|uniref:23 kDa jasmonate-induced protein-like n=1 Tax=Urochloa decumbens TaxID=240449 RepID=A0ABC8VX48_9POAL
MAAGVFGIPITRDTLIATGDYDDPTQEDIAGYAMMMINSNGSDIEAQQFVDNLKERYGNGISTKCLIYNATGITLNFADYHDWRGHVYETPYPSVIQNGQWGAFLHVKPGGAARGSIGAVVYRSKRPNGSRDSCDWMFSWMIPFTGDNTVYTEIREQGHFPRYWDYIYDAKLTKSSRNSTDWNYGYLSTTTIGEATTANARAIFQLPHSKKAKVNSAL